jgi:Spy/CpxP family protein refolding chaperone
MKKWKLAIGVILVFVLGGLAGSVGTQVYFKHWSERFWKDPRARREAFLQKLTRELGLTETQQKEFRAIIEEVDKKVEEFRQENRAEIRKVLDEGFNQMKENLNPEQQQKLEELKARHEKRRRDRWRKSVPLEPHNRSRATS